MQQPHFAKKAENISFYIFLLTIFLLPIAFLPTPWITPEVVKGFLVGIGVVTSLAFLIIARLVSGSFSFPKTATTFTAFGIILFSIIAPLFTGSWNNVFWGTGVQVGSAASFIIAMVTVFLAGVHLNSARSSGLLMGGLVLSGIVTSLIQLAHIVSPRFVTLGALGATTSTVTGSWIDYLVYVGFLTILVVATYEFFAIDSKIVGVFLWISFIIFLFMLGLGGFLWIWYGVIAILLLIFIYALVSRGRDIDHEKENSKKAFPIMAFIGVLVALVFIVGGPLVNRPLSSIFQTNFYDIRPSVSATMQTNTWAIKSNPLFGSGFLSFNKAWEIAKPEQIQLTQFFDVSWNNGSSFILSLPTTVGIVGTLLVLGFIIGALLVLLRGMLLIKKMDKGSLYVFMLSGLFELFILYTLFLNNLGWVPFLFYFLSVGISIGILAKQNLLPVRRFEFVKDPRVSFFATGLLAVLFIATCISFVTIGTRFASFVFYTNGLKSAQKVDTYETAIADVVQAARLAPSDLYYQALSSLYIAKFSNLAKNTKDDTSRGEIKDVISQAEDSARLAVAFDNRNYINWVSLANVYAALVPAGITDAYDNAKTALQKAIELAPRRPSLHLALANLAVGNKNTDVALSEIAEALSVKPNYTDAIFLQADIAFSSGDLNGAIRQVEKATTVDSRNPYVYYQLGLLKYRAGDYAGSVDALLWAKDLVPGSAPVQFYLALAYEKVGKNDKAEEILTALSKQFPEDTNVKKALDDLTQPAPAPTPVPTPTTTPAKKK